jgi:hypothetical protein
MNDNDDEEDGPAEEGARPEAPTLYDRFELGRRATRVHQRLLVWAGLVGVVTVIEGRKREALLVGIVLGFGEFAFWQVRTPKLRRRQGAALALGLAVAVVAAVVILKWGGTAKRSAALESSKTPLRLEAVPVGLRLFDVAFSDDHGLPSANEGWDDLHTQGGVDLYESQLSLIFSNRSDVDLNVRRVQLVITAAGPASIKSEYYVFSQGDEAVRQWAARFLVAERGSRADVYPAVDGVPGWLARPAREPYFPTNTLPVPAGKIRQARLVVRLPVQGRSVSYRVIATVSTPTRDFIVKSSPLRIANGAQSQRLPDSYVLGAIAYGADGTLCNVDGWVSSARFDRLECAGGKLEG